MGYIIFKQQKISFHLLPPETEIIGIVNPAQQQQQMNNNTIQVIRQAMKDHIPINFNIFDEILKVANGEMTAEQAKAAFGMTALLEAILEDIPDPSVHSYNKEVSNNSSHIGESFVMDPFSMTATTVGYDSYLGRTCTGRIYSGSISMNKQVSVLRRNSTGEGINPSSTITGIFVNRGISRTPLEPAIAYAGDIVTLAGVPNSMRT